MSKQSAHLAAALLMAVSLAAPLAAPAWAKPELQKVASFEHQVTGVTVTKGGRIFVDLPRWTVDTPVSVAD